MTEKSFGTPQSKTHIINKSKIGWGEPPEHRAYCSCGWTAVPILESFSKHELTDDASETRINGYIPPLRPIVEVYGEKEINGEFVIGNEDLILVQILHHLNYDPVFDINTAKSDFSKAKNSLSEKLNDSELRNSVNTLEKASEELIEARNRNRVFNTIKTLPEKPVLNTKIQRLIKLSIANHYSQSRDSLTNDDRIFLETETRKLHEMRDVKNEE